MIHSLILVLLLFITAPAEATLIELTEGAWTISAVDDFAIHGPFVPDTGCPTCGIEAIFLPGLRVQGQPFNIGGTADGFVPPMFPGGPTQEFSLTIVSVIAHTNLSDLQESAPFTATGFLAENGVHTVDFFGSGIATVFSLHPSMSGVQFYDAAIYTIVAPVTVPEPATWSLLLMGLTLGLVHHLRTRKPARTD